MSAGEIIGWLIAGVAAVWLAVEKLLPMLAKSWVRSKQAEQQFEQTRDADAFKQTISINETLINFFIESYEDFGRRLSAIEKKMENLMSVSARTKTELEISNRERVQMEEILSDIDVLLHEIRAAQQTINVANSQHDRKQNN